MTDLFQEQGWEDETGCGAAREEEEMPASQWHKRTQLHLPFVPKEKSGTGQKPSLGRKVTSLLNSDGRMHGLAGRLGGHSQGAPSELTGDLSANCWGTRRSQDCRGEK